MKATMPSEVQDDDLMDDLCSQLDSKDQNVQAESAAVITEMQVHQPVPDPRTKQDSKSRHKARQVRTIAVRGF